MIEPDDQAPEEQPGEQPTELYQVSEDLILEDYQRFYNFVKTVILPAEPESHKQHAPFHLNIMMTACEPMSATAAARGSLKSTILARYRPLFRLVDPTPGTTPIKQLYMIILSETTGLAVEHLEWIKWHLTKNPHLLARYGDLTDPSKLTWNEDEIELINGNKCLAFGYESRFRGKHPTDLIIDDLESDKNIGTDESLKKLKNYFFRVLMPALMPESRLTVIGTIVRNKSLLQDLTASQEFKGRVWRALNEATEEDYQKMPSLIKDGYYSIWPQRWPVDYLLKLKARWGTHRFNAEMQNMPVGMEDPIIWQEWIRRHTDEALMNLKPIRRYMAVDPAFTEEKWGCYSAIIVFDEAPDGRLYERLAWRKKVAAPDLIRSIISIYHQMARDCPDIRCGVEEVAAQKAIRQSIRELDPSLGDVLIPLRPDKDKVRRLVDVSRYYEMGLVSHKTESYIDEILNAPNGDMDRVDAGVYCLKMYERDHPVQLDSSLVELDPTLELGHNEKELYISRAIRGEPGYSASSQQLKDYQEAQWLSEMLEGL